MIRIGADVGGTFTDIVVDTGANGRVARKVPSTPGQFERAVIDGSVDAVAATGEAIAAVVDFRHGTTVATNAVLERNGPATGLLTTEGFRDVLELGRLRTPALYDLAWRKPPALSPRRFRLELAERMRPDGTSVLKPDLDALRTRVEHLVAAGVRTIAVSLINAYADPAHEELVAAWIRAEYPDVAVTVATNLVRELGEYERTSTAVLNAYLQPVVAGYLRRLQTGLTDRGGTAPLLVMQSSGGMTPVSDAERFPAHILESGPAAGVLAAAVVARRAELARAVSFDMGGTTAKASLIEDGGVSYSIEFSVGSDVSSASQLLKGGGYAVHLPVVDLAEVGAGGGSIAMVDAAGGLQVGPRSAGADPGPACYGRGGDAATVTDANLILGYLNPAGLAAGGVTVDRQRARAAIARHVAEPLGLSVEEAALAVHAVADRQMARALRAVTTERGRDAHEHTLIAFGGSGPLHAASLADVVGVHAVVVPPLAGVFSAVGLLDAPLEMTASQTVSLPLDAASLDALRHAIADARAATVDRFRHAGLDPATASIGQVLELRYHGQASELPLAIGEPGQPDGLDEPAAAVGLGERFTQLHKRTYGHTMTASIEVVRVRTTVTAAGPPSLTVAPAPATSSGVERVAYFGGGAGSSAGAVPAPVVTRGELAEPRVGPLLVDDTDTTTVVPPGWTVRSDGEGNLRLERTR